MALKTFNISDEVYTEFSKHCKKEGISMSKRIENFIKQEIDKIRNLKKPRRSQEQKQEEKSQFKYHSDPLNFETHSFSKYC